MGKKSAMSCGRSWDGVARMGRDGAKLWENWVLLSDGDIRLNGRSESRSQGRRGARRWGQPSGSKRLVVLLVVGVVQGESWVWLVSSQS